MRILAIETSCDETAIALVEANGGLTQPKFKILKNLVASQIKIHRPFGGIVPTLAKREHIRNLPLLWQRIMNNELGIRKEKLKNKKTIIHNSKFIIPDLIAVTVGPGLEPALWTGINFAKELRKRIMNYESGIRGKKSIIPIIGVNHLDGHLYSFLLSQKNKNSIIHNSRFVLQNIFPAIALLVSGGHTILLKMDSLTKYKKLGETRDDAVGEAFDKVARLLELPYPGGPEIEKLAIYGRPTSIDFPRPMLNQKNYDFSFSGLKTSVLYYLRDNKLAKKENVAASFQKAAFDVLISKTLRAAVEFSAEGVLQRRIRLWRRSASGEKAKSIMISGGVAASKTLRKQFRKEIEKHSPNSLFIIPDSSFCTDNAAMIAAAGYINYLRKKKRKLVANGNLTI